MGSSAMTWRAPELGRRAEVQARGVTIPYFESGEGSPVVFVHGALVNANLWRGVAGRLAAHARCIVLDLPLGSHTTPVPEALDVSPPGLADLIADTIEAIGLDDVTLVGNDTGGALSQIVVTRRPERIGRLVLTSCDAFDNFPPKPMQPLMPVLRTAPGLFALAAPLRVPALRKRMMTAIRATKRPVDPKVADTYALPSVRLRAIRRDLQRLLAGMDKRHTLVAAERLAEFDRPALIAWSREDKFFPRRHAEQLSELLPHARIEWIEDSYTFSPEDQPGRLADLIAAFVREERPVPA